MTPLHTRSSASAKTRSPSLHESPRRHGTAVRCFSNERSRITIFAVSDRCFVPSSKMSSYGTRQRNKLTTTTYALLQPQSDIRNAISSLPAHQTRPAWKRHVWPNRKCSCRKHPLNCGPNSHRGLRSHLKVNQSCQNGGPSRQLAEKIPATTETSFPSHRQPAFLESSLIDILRASPVYDY